MLAAQFNRTKSRDKSKSVVSPSSSLPSQPLPPSSPSKTMQNSTTMKATTSPFSFHFDLPTANCDDSGKNEIEYDEFQALSGNNMTHSKKKNKKKKKQNKKKNPSAIPETKQTPDMNLICPTDPKSVNDKTVSQSDKTKVLCSPPKSSLNRKCDNIGNSNVASNIPTPDEDDSSNLLDETKSISSSHPLILNGGANTQIEPKHTELTSNSNSNNSVDKESSSLSSPSQCNQELDDKSQTKVLSSPENITSPLDKTLSKQPKAISIKDDMSSKKTRLIPKQNKNQSIPFSFGFDFSSISDNDAFANQNNDEISMTQKSKPSEKKQKKKKKKESKVPSSETSPSISKQNSTKQDDPSQVNDQPCQNDSVSCDAPLSPISPTPLASILSKSSKSLTPPRSKSPLALSPTLSSSSPPTTKKTVSKTSLNNAPSTTAIPVISPTTPPASLCSSNVDESHSNSQVSEPTTRSTDSITTKTPLEIAKERARQLLSKKKKPLSSSKKSSKQSTSSSSSTSKKSTNNIILNTSMKGKAIVNQKGMLLHHRKKKSNLLDSENTVDKKETDTEGKVHESSSSLFTFDFNFPGTTIEKNPSILQNTIKKTSTSSLTPKTLTSVPETKRDEINHEQKDSTALRDNIATSSLSSSTYSPMNVSPIGQSNDNETREGATTKKLTQPTISSSPKSDLDVSKIDSKTAIVTAPESKAKSLPFKDSVKHIIENSCHNNYDDYEKKNDVKSDVKEATPTNSFQIHKAPTFSFQFDLPIPITTDSTNSITSTVASGNISNKKKKNKTKWSKNTQSALSQQNEPSLSKNPKPKSEIQTLQTLCMSANQNESNILPPPTLCSALKEEEISQIASVVLNQTNKNNLDVTYVVSPDEASDNSKNHVYQQERLENTSKSISNYEDSIAQTDERRKDQNPPPGLSYESIHTKQQQPQPQPPNTQTPSPKTSNMKINENMKQQSSLQSKTPQQIAAEKVKQRLVKKKPSKKANAKSPHTTSTLKETTTVKDNIESSKRREHNEAIITLDSSVKAKAMVNKKGLILHRLNKLKRDKELSSINSSREQENKVSPQDFTPPGSTVSNSSFAFDFNLRDDSDKTSSSRNTRRNIANQSKSQSTNMASTSNSKALPIKSQEQIRLKALQITLINDIPSPPNISSESNDISFDTSAKVKAIVNKKGIILHRLNKLKRERDLLSLETNKMEALKVKAEVKPDKTNSFSFEFSVYDEVRQKKPTTNPSYLSSSSNPIESEWQTVGAPSKNSGNKIKKKNSKITFDPSLKAKAVVNKKGLLHHRLNKLKREGNASLEPKNKSLISEKPITTRKSPSKSTHDNDDDGNKNSFFAFDFNLQNIGPKHHSDILNATTETDTKATLTHPIKSIASRIQPDTTTTTASSSFLQQLQKQQNQSRGRRRENKNKFNSQMIFNSSDKGKGMINRSSTILYKQKKMMMNRTKDWTKIPVGSPLNTNDIQTNVNKQIKDGFDNAFSFGFSFNFR